MNTGGLGSWFFIEFDYECLFKTDVTPDIDLTGLCNPHIVIYLFKIILNL